MKAIKTGIILAILLTALFGAAFGLTVHAATDKTALIAAKDEVQGIMDTQAASPVGDPYYQTDSYDAFILAIDNLGGMAGIQAVIDDDLALQDDINTLTQAINDAINGLILSDTYYATMANFSQAKALDLTPYTSASQALYNSELDRIDLILKDPTAGDSVINGLNADIDAAADLLVLRGDKTELLATKANLDALYASSGTDYIPSTFAAFKSAYDGVDAILLDDIGMTLQQLIDNVDAVQTQVDAATARLNAILDVLVVKPDKQDLINDYSAAVALDDMLYTSSSYAMFTSGLVAIQAVIDDVEATQADVNQAMADLAALYDILVARADLTALQTAYDNASTIPLDSYTPNSVALYQAVLASVQATLSSDDTDQSEADQAMADLTAASTLLVSKADKALLVTLNNRVITAYYEERNQYTASSYAAFKAAVDTYGSYLYVNSVINDPNVSQTAVDQLATTLENALNLLDPMIDNSELLVAYLALKNKDVSAYTTQSVTAYENELDRIHDVITGNEFGSDAAIEILYDMTTVTGLLVPLPDFTALQELYDSTDIYREEDYSVTSYGALVMAKNNAMNVINDGNADQTMVDNAMVQLQTAIDELTQKAERISITQGQTLDLSTYVTLGSATITAYRTDDQTIASVDSEGIMSANHYGDTKIYIDLSNGYTETLDIHVKAKVTTTVYVLTFTIPVASIGLAAAVVYIRKDTWLKIWQSVRGIFKKS